MATATKTTIATPAKTTAAPAPVNNAVKLNSDGSRSVVDSSGKSIYTYTPGGVQSGNTGTYLSKQETVDGGKNIQEANPKYSEYGTPDNPTNTDPAAFDAYNAKQPNAAGGVGPINTPPQAAPVQNQPTIAPAAPTGGVSGQTNPTVAGAPATTPVAPSKFETAATAAQASGVAAPATGGAAKAQGQQFVPQQGQDTSYIDQQLAQDPIYQQETKLLNDSMSAQSQKDTLVSQYQKLVKSSGLNEINTELVNTQKIINGTEDDIRSEVTAANGFATDSQVLALASSRNKTLIQNYNGLLATRDNIQNQINTQISLAGQDQQAAQQRVSQTLQIANQVENYRQQFISNAQEGYKNTITALGYDGLYNALKSDPTTLSNAEQVLGLPSGGLSQAATVAATQRAKQDQMDNLDIQSKKATIANTYSEIDARNNTGNSGLNLTPYLNTSSSGVQYMDASSLQGTASEKTQLINQAAGQGIKVITNKNTAADLVNIQDAKSKLDTISTIMAGVGQPGWVSRALGGLGATKIATALQSNPQKAAAGSLQSVGLDILKAISGVQGFRGNATAVQQVSDHLPKITDTVDTINQKVNYVNQLISDRENAALGTSNTANDQVVNGVTYTQGSDGLYYPK